MSRSLREIEAECLIDGANFFGRENNNVENMVICMTGELGEFANMVKKIMRGSLNYEDPQIAFALRMELTDLFIYLCNTAAILDMDLELAYDHKRAINVERFGSAKRPYSQGNNGVRSEGFGAPGDRG